MEAIMENAHCSDNFKRDAVRGFPVREVSERLGSAHTLCVWIKTFWGQLPVRETKDHAVKNRQLILELVRLTEERDGMK